MATQKIQYSTKSRLPCGCTPGAGVIFCVSKSLTADGSGTLEGTIVSEVLTSNGCNGQFYSYQFSFDDTQLAENVVVTSNSIRGAFCKGCLTDWVESLIASGDAWQLLGNAGTVDGTNFIGTTDNVAHDVRVNNLRVRRSVPETECPNIIDGGESNTIVGSGSTIGGGGADRVNFPSNFHTITGGWFSTIGGGSENIIVEIPDPHTGGQGPGFSTISGGLHNKIDESQYPFDFGAGTSTIGGGEANQIVACDDGTISGGDSNLITYANLVAHAGPDNNSFWGDDSIGGGNSNTISGIYYSVTPPDNLGCNTISGGSNSIITNAFASGVGAGQGNSIYNSDGSRADFNFIGGGNGLLLSNCDGCFIGGGGQYISSGKYSKVESGFYSTIAGGAGNSINPDGTNQPDNYGGYSTISGGADHHIKCGKNDSYTFSNGRGFHTIAGGQSNLIQYAGGCASIGGGFINLINYDDGVIDQTVSFIDSDAICGGNVNLILGNKPFSGTPLAVSFLGRNFIGGGETNEIDNGMRNVVGGGWANLILDSGHADTYSPDTYGPLCANAILGGAFNSIQVGQQSLLGGGLFNTIFGDNLSSIIGGFGNVIFATTPTTPPGDATINPSTTLNVANAILGGEFNYISNGFNSTILGGAFLKIGASTVGYQNAATRDFSVIPAGNPSVISLSQALTGRAQVDISAFSSLAYFGDVDLWLANTNNTATKLKFFEPNADLDFSSTNYSSFKAQAQGANIDYIWPATAGTAGQQLTIDTVVGTVVTLKWA